MRIEKEVVILQEEIKRKIREIGVKAPASTYLYELLIVFYFDKYYWMILTEDKLRRYDLTNLWKPSEDAIIEGLGLDDSMCLDQRQVKGFLPTPDPYILQTPPYYYAVEVNFYRADQ